MTEPPSKLRTVEQTSGEMRVTLRQGGWARWLPAIVRILWLGGWSLGEVLIGNVLLSFTPFAWRIPAPELLASMSAGSERAPSFGIVIFIAAWWLLWTMGGIGSFVTVLRLLFGSDRITMTTDGFRRWRGVGPFGMERELRSGDVSAISIRDSRAEMFGNRFSDLACHPFLDLQTSRVTVDEMSASLLTPPTLPGR